jgi:nucleotide-binding universal stress UspA family protein
MPALRRLLVGLDLTETTEQLVGFLPALRSWGVEEVTLIHVATESLIPLLHHSDSTRGVGGRLAEAGVCLQAHFEVRLCLRAGDPGACLAEEADARGVDGVVLGVRDRGTLRSFLVGRTVSGVARRTGRPILLFPLCAPGAGPELPLVLPQPTRVLHPTDLAGEGGRDFEQVKELAAEGALPVTLLHVVEEGGAPGDEPGPGVLEAMAGALRYAGVPEVSARVEKGRPWERILALAAEDPHTLVVMGTRARRTLPAIVLGSQSREVVRRARLPLLLVPKGPLGHGDEWPGSRAAEPPSPRGGAGFR